MLARIFWLNSKPRRASTISTISRTWPPTFCSPDVPTWCALNILQKSSMHSIHLATSLGLTIIFHEPSYWLMTMKNAQQICNAASTYFRPCGVNTGLSSSMNTKTRTLLISAWWLGYGATVCCTAANLLGPLVRGIQPSALSGT